MINANQAGQKYSRANTFQPLLYKHVKTAHPSRLMHEEFMYEY